MTSWRALRRPWWLALVLVMLCLLLADPLVHRLDDLGHDLLTTHLPGRAGTQETARHVLVEIDDSSLQQHGAWPWPAALQARLIDRLTAAGARLVVHDVLVTAGRPDPADPIGERMLAAAVARHGRVLMPVAESRDSVSGQRRTLGPGPELQQALAGLGHVEVLIDGDGMVRRLQASVSHGQTRWRALALVAGDLLATASHPANTAGDDAVLILPGQQPEIERYAASQVLDDPTLAPRLRDAVVWVGLTAQGLAPVLGVPAAQPHQRLSGVEWQAQVGQAQQRGQLVRPLPEWLCHVLNLLPLALMALWQTVRPRPLRLRGLWLLPLPMLSSAALLGLAHVWVPTAALTIGLGLALVLTRNRELRLARLALRMERGRADATLQAITDGVLTVDPDGRMRYLNPSAERLIGQHAERLLGQSVLLALPWDASDAQRLAEALERCRTRRRGVDLGAALRLRSERGERRVQIVASPVFEQAARPTDGVAGKVAGRVAASTLLVALDSRLPTDQGGRVVALVLALSDVTEQLAAAERLQRDATHDALTGLPNRALLSDRLQQAVLGAHAGNRSIAILFIDLDRFKRINDSLGHRQGDQVLRTVAARLQGCLRAHDTLARWGGDEFVALLEDAHDREVVAARAAQMIDAVTRELHIETAEAGAIEVACGCSIGIAMTPQDGLAADALLAMADTAMYRGKARGGRRFEFHASGMPAWTREWLALETRLRHALEQDSFVLHYQPQVDLRSGQVAGLEALLRWRQPDGSLWRPARFLPVTEETSLILHIGEWVVREAVAQMARWRAQGLPLVPVSVNVSTRQCLDRRLVRVVAEALAEHAVAASLLKIEVTESTAMADLGQLRSLLAELREMGVQVSMDDFGTGFSSLSHLRNFRVDQIKIDPSFVRDISRDPNGAAIVRATIALAHGLGLPVVAEGVESEEQMTFLTEHDCDIAQGYLYAQAQDSGTIATLLRDRVASGLPMSRSRSLPAPTEPAPLDLLPA